MLEDLHALVEFAQAGQLGQLHHHADLADVSASLKVQEGGI